VESKVPYNPRHVNLPLFARATDATYNGANIEVLILSNPILPLHFPQASDATLIGMALTLGGLVAGAVSWDYYRKMARKKRFIRTDWDIAADLMREKQLDKAQVDLLTQMIRKYHDKNPLASLTVRQQFDALIDKRMRDAAKAHDDAAFQDLGKKLYEVRLRLGLDFVPYGRSIQSTRELRTGQLLWLHPSDLAPDWAMASVSSTDEAYFGVTFKEPYAFDLMAPGRLATFRLWRQDDGRYHFELPVAAAQAGGSERLFHHTTKLARIQERCYYRIRCSIETYLKRNDDNPGISFADAPQILPVRICSLSAGGFAALAEQPMPNGVMVRIPLQLSGELPFEIEARMIGGSALGGGRHIVRGQFLGAFQESQDVIARYVARKQQALAEEAGATENK
jgi:hypothetical protein